MKKSILFGILTLSLVLIIAHLPFQALCQEKKSPPPGAPTDQDPKAYQGLTPGQIEKLKDGGVVILNSPEDLFGRKMIVTAIIMNQDIDTVWNLLTQPWRQEEYQRGLETSKLVEKWDGGNRVDFQVKVMTVEIKYRMIHTNEKEKYFIHWRLDPDYDNEMKEAMGFFRLYWIDENHTLVRYGTVAESKFLIPPKIQTFILKQSIPDAFNAVKEWVDSGGTYKKKKYEPEEE